MPPPGSTAPCQFLSIQHDVAPVAALAGIVHGPLVHVALDRAVPAGVLAGGDPHPVAAAPHPTHAPDDRD